MANWDFYILVRDRKPIAMALNTDASLLSAHEDLLSIFHGAADATSELIPIEDCPNEELAPVLHISQVMLARAQEQAYASIELFLSGHWAAFEALSRISLEYSVRFSALMNDDPRKTLGSYLGGHFLEMEKRQGQMRDTLVAAGDEHALHQLDSARQHMLLRQELVNAYANFCGFSLMQGKMNPRAYDHFNALGKASLYRGLYSVLSSQVHADAETLVDYIVIHCVQRTDEERDIAAQEMHHWMAHFLVKLIAAYVEACNGFARRFSLDSMSRQLEEMHRRVTEIEDRYSNDFRQFETNATDP
jgi:hypothetical protein